MKIISSQLSFNADRKYEEKAISTRVVESLEDRVSLSGSGSSSGRESALTGNSDKITIRQGLFPPCTDVSAACEEDGVPSDPKLASMKRILEAMMGKKLKFMDVSEFQRGTASSAAQLSGLNLNIQGGSNSTAETVQQPDVPVTRVRITEFNSYYEAEATQFKALGSVKTDGGESINFTLRLDMNRQFYSESRSQLTTDATLIDPLVVNFSGKPAELTDIKFKFDINSDGKDDEISWLSSGSGFLVLDKNLDGVINSGSEMFGPATDNGFEELALLDEDKNGWIDENDAAFEKLSVWSGDTPETAGLKSLKESGIGAIAVSSAETQFSLKDNSQNTLGQIRRTGIYLEENGKAGTIQQLDLAL